MCLQAFFRIGDIVRSLDIRLKEFIIILKHNPWLNIIEVDVELILNYFQYLYKVLPKFYVMFLVKLNLHESHSHSIVKTLSSISETCR